MRAFARPSLISSLFVGTIAAITGAAGCSEEKNVRPPPSSTPADPNDAGGPTTPENDAGGPKLDPLGPEFADLGEVGPTFELDVPEGTLGFSFSTGTATVVSVTDPTGKQYLATAAPTGMAAPYSDLNHFPSASTRLDVPPGKWSVTLSAAAQVKVARQRTSDGKFHGGVLDLFVYLPTGVHAEDFIGEVKPGVVVDSTKAPGNPVITRYVDHLYAQVKRLLDLDRGTVKFLDVSATYLTIADQTAATLAANVGSRSTKTDVGLHVLFTENLFEETANGTATPRGGVDHDRPANAVIVDLKNMEPPGSEVSGYAVRGFVAADLPVLATLHQAGRLLGLAETSDRTITPWDDGFSDTPTCSIETLTNSDNLCQDNLNLMFPLQNQPTAKVVLSEHQKAVLRGTTFYKPYGP